VRSLTAAVQADNERMLWLIRRLLPGARLEPDAGVYAVRAPLGAPPPVPVTAGR
jgi:hypothetical protein